MFPVESDLFSKLTVLWVKSGKCRVTIGAEKGVSYEEGMDEEGICYEEEYLRYLVLFPTSKWVAGLVFYENG